MLVTLKGFETRAEYAGTGPGSILSTLIVPLPSERVTGYAP